MSNIKQNKTLVATALISSILSIGIHLYLTLNHYKLKLGVAEGKSLCNINNHLNCDVVAISKYASLMNYPIAAWGALTHIILSLFLSLWFIGLLKNSNRVMRISTWLAFFIAAMSLVMGAISSFSLGTFCLFCIFTYLLSFIILGCLLPGLTVSLFENLGNDLKSLIGDHKWILFCFILIPGGVVFSGNIIQEELLGTDGDTLRGIIQDSVSNWQSLALKTFSEKQGLILQSGSEPAKVTIVEFADFLCPHCKALSTPMHNFILAHPGVRLIYKPFPLDGICNEGNVPKHDGLRCELTYAVFCAENLSHRGWEAHEYVFEHQSEWEISRIDKDLEKMSSELSLNFSQLKECMQKSDIHQMTLDAAKEGNGIQGTPTIFVNGRELPHGNVLPVLESAVNSLNP